MVVAVRREKGDWVVGIMGLIIHMFAVPNRASERSCVHHLEMRSFLCRVSFFMVFVVVLVSFYLQEE